MSVQWRGGAVEIVSGSIRVTVLTVLGLWVSAETSLKLAVQSADY